MNILWRFTEMQGNLKLLTGILKETFRIIKGLYQLSVNFNESEYKLIREDKKNN